MNNEESFWRILKQALDPRAMLRVTVAICVVVAILVAFVEIIGVVYYDQTITAALLGILMALALLSPILLVIRDERRRKREE